MSISRFVVIAVALFHTLLPLACIGAEEHGDGDWDNLIYADIARVPPHLRKGLSSYKVKALLKAAHACERGDGVPKDLNLATRWYERAATFGSAEAKAWLKKEEEREQIPALMYGKGESLRFHGKNSDEKIRGLALIQKAADLGYSPAQQELAILYLDGDDLPQDIDMAAHYFKQAALYFDRDNDKTNVAFRILIAIYDDEKYGHYNPKQAYYFLALTARLFRGIEYIVDEAKKYDKLTPQEKARIKKLADRWKPGMPFWEADKEQ